MEGPQLREYCEEGRLRKFQLKKIVWEKRPKLNGGIVNLIPVVDNHGRARCAVPGVFAGGPSSVFVFEPRRRVRVRVGVRIRARVANTIIQI